MGYLEKIISGNRLGLPLAGLVAGILVYPVVGHASVAGLLFIAAGFIIYYLLIRAGSTPFKAYRLRKYHYIWIPICFFGTGLLVCDLAQYERIDDGLPVQCDKVSGRVIEVRSGASGDQIVLCADRLIYSDGRKSLFSNLRILVKTTHSPGEVDDLVVFPARLDEICDYENSFRKGYASYFAAKGIFYECTVIGDRISVYGHSSTLSGLSTRLRHSVEALIENSYLDKRTQNFLITVLLGDREYLDSDLKTLFSHAGISHVLALSGMHVGIIVSILLVVLFPLNMAGCYKARLIVTAILLWLYAFISGLSPSTVRACLMYSFWAVALIAERKNSVFNSMSGAALLILLFSPEHLWDPGFQLSFICVFSLAAFADCLNPVAKLHNPRIHRICGVVVSTLICTVCSWVVVSYYFDTFPLVFLVANILVLPLLPLYLSVAIVHIILVAVGIDLWVTGNILDGGMNAVTTAVEWIAPSQTALHIEIPLFCVIAWIAGISFMAWHINVSRSNKTAVVAAGLFMFSFCGMIMTPDAVPEHSFIIRNDYREIKLTYIENGIEKTAMFDRGVASGIDVGNKKLLFIDCDTVIKEIPRGYHYLVVCGGFKGDIVGLTDYVGPDIVVIHPSVRRKRELEILRKMKDSQIPVHSIRYSRSLKVLSTDPVGCTE